jgi:hypothetical protein
MKVKDSCETMNGAFLVVNLLTERHFPELSFTQRKISQHKNKDY